MDVKRKPTFDAMDKRHARNRSYDAVEIGVPWWHVRSATSGILINIPSLTLAVTPTALFQDGLDRPYVRDRCPRLGDGPLLGAVAVF